jgi:hypothetical protein
MFGTHALRRKSHDDQPRHALTAARRIAPLSAPPELLVRIWMPHTQSRSSNDWKDADLSMAPNAGARRSWH